MTLVPFYSLLTVEGAKCVKVVTDNIMAGKQEKQWRCLHLVKHPSVALLFLFPYFFLLFITCTFITKLQLESKDLVGLLLFSLHITSFPISNTLLMFLLLYTDYRCSWADPSILFLSLPFLPFLFPSSCLHPLSIIHSSSQVVFIEWLRMHRLLSSTGLWPTLVSVLALFVHPLLFHLFSYHHHHLLLLPLLLRLPLYSRLSIHLFSRWEDLWDCINTLFTCSSCLPVSFFILFFTFLCLLSVSAPFHLPLLITPPPPHDSSLPCLLASSVNVSAVFPVSSSITSSDAFPSTPPIAMSWSAGTIDPASSISTEISKPLKNTSLCCSTH